MADFLNDLPSFNKENFKNFQPSFNRLQPKTQSTFHCTKQYTDPQIVVNQKYNIVVKYFEDTLFNEKCVLNVNKKRDMPSSSSSNNEPNENETNSSDNESKSFKKLRTSASEELMLIEPGQTTLTGTSLSSSEHLVGMSSTANSSIQIDEEVQDHF